MSSYVSTILGDTPQAYYRMDESSGTRALDVTGHGYHATLSGAYSFGYPGAIASDTNTAIFFGSGGTLTFPSALNIPTWTALSIELWTNVSGRYQYIAVTTDGRTTTTYVNGAYYPAGLGGTSPIEISSIFDSIAVLGNNSLDEVALYNYVLGPAQIAHHYALGIYSPLIASLPGQIPLPNPADKPVFGIGTYQSLSGGAIFGEGVQRSFSSVHHPYAGIYGGTYGFLLDTTIRSPQQTTYTPAPEIGLDATGVSVVRGYPSIVWSYTTLRPDFWYYLKWLYWQSAMNTPPPYQYLVLVQYPDTSGYNNPVQVLARMDPPTHSYRDVAAYYGATLTFKYIGQAQIIPGTPITVI
jgi:hypothetical protein